MTIETLLPLISSIITLGLGSFVFSSNKGSSVNRLFLFFSLSISVGLFSTFMMFVSGEDTNIVLFWDRMVYIGVVFIPVAMYHFGLAVLNKSEKYTKILLRLGYTTSFLFLIVLPTDLFISDVYVYQWGAHAKAQFLHHFFMLYFFSYFLLWLSFMHNGYKLETDPIIKTKLKLVFISFLILVGVGSFGFLPAYEIPIYPFSYISGIIFVIILFYAIFKYHLFHIKLILVELALFLLNGFLFINMFTSRGEIDLALNSFVSLFIFVFSIFLLRGIYKDIRDRERIRGLVQEVALANERLYAMEQQKTEFVSIASHQLRTPLTVIKGYASMVLDGTFGTLNENARDAMEKLYKSSERIVALVEDLLTVSHIEQGRVTLSLETVNFKDFIQKVIDEARGEAEVAKVNLSFSVEYDKELYASIDEKKFRQAVYHILENAIKYTPQAGAVNVSISADNIVNKVRLVISDTGIGMTQEQVNTIFEQFNLKVNSAATAFGQEETVKEVTEDANDDTSPESDLSEKRNPGIGLYIAQEIIDAHRGTISIKSSGLNKGVTVFVEIPSALKQD